MELENMLPGRLGPARPTVRGHRCRRRSAARRPRGSRLAGI